MDIDKVINNYQILIDHMKSDNFGRVACGAIKPMVMKMKEHKGEYNSYPDFYEKFIDKEGIFGNTRRLRYYRTTVRHIWAFDEYNSFPDRAPFNPLVNMKCSYYRLNTFFKDIVDEYIRISQNRLLNPHTIKVDKNIASLFFVDMQKNGVEDFDGITLKLTTAFFIKDGKYIRGNDMASKLKKVLKCFSGKYPHLEEIIKYIPMRKDVVNLQDMITDEEVRIAKQTIKEMNIDMNLRDRAIIAIALYTGMRGCDIVNLTIDNIDWANDRISLIQSKTQQLLTLPLTGSVGNCIYDYIVKEWPKEFNSKALFFNLNKRGQQLGNDNVGAILERFFTKLGIKCKGKQRRIRILRHYLASKLLSVGTEPAVISSILGHSKPETLNHYVDMDIENLRQCSLDVSIYPLSKEIIG